MFILSYYIYIYICIHHTSYCNCLYTSRYQNGDNRQRLTFESILPGTRTQTIHTSYVTKCSFLCAGHLSYSYGSTRGMTAWEHERDRCASETVEQREKRLFVRRERDRTRRAAWSKEERETALLRMSAYGRSRLAIKLQMRDGPLAAVTYKTVVETSWRAYRWQIAVTYVCAQNGTSSGSPHNALSIIDS